MLTPTQNPRLNLMQAGQGYTKFNFAPSQFLELLAGMPNALTDQLSGKFVEANANIVLTLAGENTETILQVILQ